MSLAGLRILSLETRRATDMETLILREQGLPFLAPSVKERAVDENSVAVRFVEDLEAGRYDAVVCMTGAGLAFLRETVAPLISADRLGAALRRVTIISRGPKPVGVLRELGVPVHVMIPEPNTWKEIVHAVDDRPGLRIAIQEYGRTNAEMNAALEAKGATVTPIRLYRWDKPDDLEPLREAARRLAAGRLDVVLFTASIQLDHLLEVAADLGLAAEVVDALRHRTVNASIGPVMNATLEAHGFPIDIIPRHPKMWALVKAAGEQAHQILSTKRPSAE